MVDWLHLHHGGLDPRLILHNKANTARQPEISINQQTTLPSLTKTKGILQPVSNKRSPYGRADGGASRHNPLPSCRLTPVHAETTDWENRHQVQNDNGGVPEDGFGTKVQQGVKLVIGNGNQPSALVRPFQRSSTFSHQGQDG